MSLTTSISQRVISRQHLIPKRWRWQQRQQPRCTAALQHKSHFHSSHVPHAFKPVWTEARVKMPWVEALARKRAGEEGLTSEASSLATAAGSSPTLVPTKKKWGTLKESKVLQAEGVEVQKPAAAAGVKGSGGAPRPVVDLTPKKMRDSYYKTVLPLAQDPWLLDTYLNATGHIRLGSLLMDLDALAGVVAYRHAGDAVALVTAAVDRITIEHPLKEICDLELSGQVTYATGRSSMEISLQVAKAPTSKFEKVKKDDVLITCAFTMVALDPSTKKPVSVPALHLENGEEFRLFERGERNYNDKKALRKTSLREYTPNDEESDLIHAMWMAELGYKNPASLTIRPENVLYMTDSTLRSAQIMQPEYRNRHNFMIFGGYLLKQTFELAFCCAASFSRTRPTFICLDPSTFDNPVPVGGVLYLKATVAYTDPPVISSPTKSKTTTTTTKDNNTDQKETHQKKYTRVQIRVDSSVRDVEHGTKKPTGVFNYTFLVEKDIQVMPQTYSDFMMWVDARRRAQNANASLKLPDVVTECQIKSGVTE